MALSTQPYKGARDFYPDDKRLQKYLFSKMRETVERFGYEEYDAPILEPLELYAAKTGEEIVKEQTYTFEDRGGRKVAIRPEMTPSVSRMVAAKRQELAYPLRWYSIPNLWRYERPQRGRLREHWQLNVDLFGVADASADTEVIQVADAIMQTFGAKRDTYTIRVNSRKLVNDVLLMVAGLHKDEAHQVMKLADRMHKIPAEDFRAALEEIVSEERAEAVQNLLATKNIDDFPGDVLANPDSSAKELKNVLSTLRNLGINNVEFDITIMRGFDYYTDIVFEVFDTNPENNRSMFGGGRYDGLVGLFGVEPVPTVGFGMGDVTLANFLETHGLLPKLETETDIYTILIGDVYDQAQKVVSDLRDKGLNVAIDPSGRKVDAQIKSATKKGIRYALFIGEKELADEKYTLKDLDSGQEEKYGLQQIVDAVKNNGK
jgi:histidyl-tRNA synthetase